MNQQQWYAERNDRTIRYAGRVLNPEQWILLSASPEYAARYDGQVALLTAANLLGRMTRSIALSIPDVRICAPLPWKGQQLRELILSQLYAADPFGRFEHRKYHPNDYRVHLGPSCSGTIAHGSGWNAYYGPAPSPIVPVDDLNPVGAAFAAIITASNIFVHNFDPPAKAFTLNALTWNNKLVRPEARMISSELHLGDVWTVGVGSVGTAILYFLTLASAQFSTTLFDMDIVKPHNLDRSPIFNKRDVGIPKVNIVNDFLKSVGLANVTFEKCALDESSIWQRRLPGSPDVLISAANERNVRHVIETLYPPIQIYGTTGKNWQASVIRHIPLEDPCSCCLFPNTDYAQTSCATGEVPASDGDNQVDASLPFLSFAAGAMAAAEILKLALPGYP